MIFLIYNCHNHDIDLRAIPDTVVGLTLFFIFCLYSNLNEQHDEPSNLSDEKSILSRSGKRLKFTQTKEH